MNQITESIILSKGEIGRIVLKESIASKCFQSDWNGVCLPLTEESKYIIPDEFYITGKGSTTFEAIEDYYQNYKRMLEEFSHTLPVDYQIIEVIRKAVTMVPCFPKEGELELFQNLETYLQRKPTQEELNTKYFVYSIQAWVGIPDTIEDIQEEEKPQKIKLSEKSNEELLIKSEL